MPSPLAEAFLMEILNGCYETPSKCVVDLFRLGKRKQIATDRLLAIQTDKNSLILLFINHLNATNPLNKPHNRNITV